MAKDKKEVKETKEVKKTKEVKEVSRKKIDDDHEEVTFSDGSIQVILV